MPSVERRTNENLVRAMRAANREFRSHLRRALPLNRSKKDIADFLTKVEEQCQEAERHDSDEFVYRAPFDSSPACRSLIFRSTVRQLADRLLTYPQRRLSLDSVVIAGGSRIAPVLTTKTCIMFKAPCLSLKLLRAVIKSVF